MLHPTLVYLRCFAPPLFVRWCSYSPRTGCGARRELAPDCESYSYTKLNARRMRMIKITLAWDLNDGKKVSFTKLYELPFF